MVEVDLTGITAIPFLCFGFFAFLAVVQVAFWIWMLVDCVTNEPSEGNDKVIWVLIIILLQVIGAIVYLLVRRPTRKRLYGR